MDQLSVERWSECRGDSLVRNRKETDDDMVLCSLSLLQVGRRDKLPLHRSEPDI